MFLTGLSAYLKPSVRIPGWRDNKARALGEAALLARALARAEALPIGKTLAQEGHIVDTDGWYAESILNTIPVYGTRAGAPARIDTRAGLRLRDDAQNLGRTTMHSLSGAICMSSGRISRAISTGCAVSGDGAAWVRKV